MVDERHSRETKNEYFDTTKMGSKRGLNVINGNSSDAKNLKTDAGALLEVQRSPTKENLLTVSSGDVDLDTGNNQSHDSDNLVTNQQSLTVADEKVCSSCQLTVDEAQTRNRQNEDSDTLMENKPNSTDASNKTDTGYQLTLVGADAAEDRGSQHTMEDAWVVLSDASMGILRKLWCSYFAIYDGHGGRLAAEYARAHLHANILSAGLPHELMDIKVAKRLLLRVSKRQMKFCLKKILQERGKMEQQLCVFGFLGKWF